MSSTACLLAIRADCWRLVRLANDGAETRDVPLASGSDATEAAAQVARAFAEWGGRDPAVVLGLPSDVVLPACIEYGDLPRRDRRSAMLYRLEEKLPLEAEQFTADFILLPSGKALGLAVQTEAVAPIIESLERSGLQVLGICPMALLALWDCCRQKETGRHDYVLLATDCRVEVFRMEGGLPAAWRSTDDQTDEVLRSIEADLLSGPHRQDPPRAAILGPVAPETCNSLANRGGLEVATTREVDPLAAAARAAEALAAGSGAGWVDLRRDGLAPSSPWGRLAGLVKSATILAAVFLIALTASLQWRASRYDALAEGYRQKQLEEFRRLYPAAAAPVGVARRLRSEVSALSHLSGVSGAMPQRISALETLSQTVSALPKDLRFRFTSIRIDPRGVMLEGQARAHGDAEAISAALRLAGFAVEPPRSEALTKGGVSFTLAGSPPATTQVTKRNEP